MKPYLALAILLLAQAVYGQSGVMRFTTLTNLLTYNPKALTTSQRAGLLVEGRLAAGDWGPARQLVYTTNTPGVTNYAYRWVPTNGVGFWRAVDEESLVVDVRHFGENVGTGADDTVPLLRAVAATTTGKTFYAPPGLAFKTTSALVFTNYPIQIDMSRSPVYSYLGNRQAVIQLGASLQTLTGLSLSLSSATNVFTGPLDTFAVGDMVFLYNTDEFPSGYNPGLFAFVTGVTNTTITLDRLPTETFVATRAYRFVNAPVGCKVHNVEVNLAHATNGIGISTFGKNHVVERCAVYGTGTVEDSNYIGIEVRGQSIIARDNYVSGILDAKNNVDRSGYGIFLAGDNCSADRNEINDCKHNLSTSERRSVSRELTFSHNRIRQREDWAGLTNAYGSYLFTAAVDVHANVRHILISYNDIKIGGRYALSLRNGNFDVIGNEIEVTQQDGLPFVQHGSGIAEAFITRGNFVANRFSCPSNVIHFYFGQADSGVSGTHSNLAFSANTFNGGILTFDDISGTVTNPIVGFIFNGNTVSRTVGTPLLFTSPIHDAIFVGNNILYGADGNGMSFALPGDDTTYPPREFYIVANTFTRLTGSGVDIRVLSGPTNTIELGNNRFYADPPIQGFVGNVSVSRTPKLATQRYQLIEASANELIFNPLTTGNPARYRIGASGMMMGYDSGFTAYRVDPTDIGFSTWLPGHTDKYDFSVRADGQMSWTDGTNNANVVFGPRRLQDLRVGVARLSGALGMTELLTLGTNAPEGNTINLWLSNANTAALYVRTPLGIDVPLLTSSSSLPEVANDGNYYSRTYGAWQALGSMAFVGTAPSDGYTYGLSNQIWVRVSTNTGGGGGGISDAPSDGNYYSRRNAGWSALAAMALAADATSDGSYYARRNGAWNSLGTMALINDAPNDGFGYVRSNNVWAKAITVSGGSYSNFWSDLTNALVAGGNVSFAYNTNNNKLTITASTGGGTTNGTSVSVDATGLAIANLQSTTGFTLAISGTNVLFRLADRDFGDVTVSSSGTVITIDNGVISTGKVDTAFHTWITGKAGLADNNVFTGSTNTFGGVTVFSTLVITNLTLVNPMPNYAVSNATPSRLAKWGADYRLTNEVAATGTGSPVYSDGPTLTGAIAIPNQSLGVSNTTPASTKFVYDVIASGGGGSGSSVYINNGLVNPAKFTNDAAATGGVVFRTNASGEILAYATNLPAGGSGSTNIVYVNNTFTQPARFTNNPSSNGGIIWSLDVNGNIVGTVTNVPGVTTISNLWQTLGYVDIIVENTGGTTASITYTNFGGIVTNITQLGNVGSNNRLQLGMIFNQNIGTNYLVFFDFDGANDADASYALVGWSQASARLTGGCEVSIVNNDGFVYSNDGYKIRIRIINPNAVAGLVTVPTVVTNDRLFSWSADRMLPGTNAAIQAAFRILGDGIATYEFDGTNATGDEISMIGTWQKDVSSTSYAVLNFASDDTANTVCWQVQLQALTLRGLDTNLWTTAALWTSNVPGTARVGTNIIIPIASSPFSGSGTNDFGKPYMLRVTRRPSDDSSTSNAYLLSVDHRFNQ